MSRPASNIPSSRWSRVFTMVLAWPLLCVGCASHYLNLERSRRAHLGDQHYVEIRGDSGAPVVLVPGLMGTTRFWGDSIDSLAAERRLIFVDLLGFGRSPWPVDNDYSLEGQIGALRRTLVSQRATSQVTIVGHSLGSVVAAHYAARFPGDIDRVVLLGVPVYHDRADGRRRVRKMSYTAALFTLNRTLGRMSCAIMNAMGPAGRQLAPLFRRDVPREVAMDATLHFWKSIDGSVQRVLLDHPIEKPLAVIGPKTIILHGSRDSITPHERLSSLVDRYGIRLVKTPSTHNSYPQDAAVALRSAIQGEIVELERRRSTTPIGERAMPKTVKGPRDGE